MPLPGTPHPNKEIQPFILVDLILAKISIVTSPSP
jgi:hypothetical protein